MSDDEQQDKPLAGGMLKQTIDSVTGLAKAVPIYDDAVQPLAKETGKALGTVGKAVNLALEPVVGLVWGYDKIKNFVQDKVAEKLENIPPERIQAPNPSVAGPVLESLRYNGHDADLREMYANLLATSIDSNTARDAHPGFVEIIKSMSPDEARILKTFLVIHSKPLIDIQMHNTGGGYHTLSPNVSIIGAEAGCSYNDLVPNYLNNLCRLGLLEIDNISRLKEDKLYQPIEEAPDVKQLKDLLNEKEGVNVKLKRKKVEITQLGKQFAGACIADKRVTEIKAQQGSGSND